MSNAMLCGAICGVGVFIAALSLVGQVLPEPISGPWPVFVTGIVVGFGGGCAILGLMVGIVALSMWISP